MSNIVYIMESTQCTIEAGCYKCEQFLRELKVTSKEACIIALYRYLNYSGGSFLSFFKQIMQLKKIYWGDWQLMVPVLHFIL